MGLPLKQQDLDFRSQKLLSGGASLEEPRQLYKEAQIENGHAKKAIQQDQAFSLYQNYWVT